VKDKLDATEKKALSALTVFIAAQVVVVSVGAAIDQLWIAIIPPIGYFLYVAINKL